MPSICYAVDGRSYASQTRYIPCNGTAIALGKHSACCALGDVCLSNGFCQSRSDADRKANTYWRNGCTDSTWKDGACAKVCEGMDDPDTHAVFACPVSARQASTSYCCPPTTVRLNAATNLACCGVSSLAFSANAAVSYTTADMKVISILYVTPNAVTITPNAVTITPNAVTVTTTLRPSTSSFSGTANLASARASQSPTSLAVMQDKSLAKTVGITLGVLLGAALCVVVWLCVALWNRRHGREEEMVERVERRPPSFAENPVLFVGGDDERDGRIRAS